MCGERLTSGWNLRVLFVMLMALWRLSWLIRVASVGGSDWLLVRGVLDLLSTSAVMFLNVVCWVSLMVEWFW